MRRYIQPIVLAAAYAIVTTNVAALEPATASPSIVWQPITITFSGPEAAETDSTPNPFLDMRLEVVFSGPSGQEFIVPGFFDGDGQGGPRGKTWRVRFAADESGTWHYKASFRTGPGVAIQRGPDVGELLAVAHGTGSLRVLPRDPAAPGFLKWGRLEYIGKHYLKFRRGTSVHVRRRAV